MNCNGKWPIEVFINVQWAYLELPNLHSSSLTAVYISELFLLLYVIKSLPKFKCYSVQQILEALNS